jgi:hypothetical protein
MIFFIFIGVLPAVYFYNQASFKGDEINNKIADGLLSPKLHTLYLLAFQMKPKAIFSLGCPLS